MRPHSFLLFAGNQTDLTQAVNGSLEMACRRLYPYSDKVSVKVSSGILIGMNSLTEPDNNKISSGENELWIFNDDTDGLADKAKESYEEFGISGIQGINTSGVIILRQEDQLYCYGGRLGITPIYYTSGDNKVLVATEIKALVCQDLLPVTMASEEEFRPAPYFKSSGHCLLNEVDRLTGGAVLNINLSSMTCSVIADLDRTQYPHSSLRDSINQLYIQLEDIIRKHSMEKVIGIPLSGGFDSGAVAGIANKFSEVNSFTMGTEEMNEFDSARKMSSYIDSVHHEYVIPESELIPAILHGIYLNEFADPLYAEGYCGLYFIFREAAGKVNTLLTGYGADLSLSNFLGGPLSEMSKTGNKLIRRTSWTGELTTNVSSHFGLNVVHPFLDRDLVDYILSMPTAYKVCNGVEKYIEKELIIDYSLMPMDLLKMEKKALHTGAGIDRLFNKVLGIKNDEDYIIKSKFLYHAWKELILDNVNASNVDIDKLVYLTKRRAT